MSRWRYQRDTHSLAITPRRHRNSRCVAVVGTNTVLSTLWALCLLCSWVGLPGVPTVGAWPYFDADLSTAGQPVAVLLRELADVWAHCSSPPKYVSTSSGSNSHRARAVVPAGGQSRSSRQPSLIVLPPSQPSWQHHRARQRRSSHRHVCRHDTAGNGRCRWGWPW